LKHHLFAILPTAANRLVARLHDRMPVILHLEDEATWLHPETSPAQPWGCLKPFRAHLLPLMPVSPKVNAPASNAPGLLQRVTHDRHAGALHEQATAAEAGLLFPDPAPV
jgi:putative SOS response-associated peptidase YedK